MTSALEREQTIQGQKGCGEWGMGEVAIKWADEKKGLVLAQPLLSNFYMSN